MPSTRTMMRRIREVLRLKYQLGLNDTQVASGGGIARAMVQDYVRRITACGANREQLLALATFSYFPLSSPNPETYFL
jgi:hypothetical protein